MTSKLKKCSILALIVFTIMIFKSSIALASASDIKDMGSKKITDTNKVWTVSFKSEVDMNSLSGNVQIKDITNSNTFTPSISPGDNSYSVKINAPAGGYTIGHKYQLVLKDAIKSKKGKVLPKTTVLTFSVISNDSSSYSIKANVVVSPVIPIFKKVTIISTNSADVQKYKVEGNDDLFDIGKSMTLVANSDTVKVYIYNSKGTVIGTANMDVSTDKSDMTLNFN